jgi:hypothetical protein
MKNCILFYGALVIIAPSHVWAQNQRCPAAKHLPQLSIEDIKNSNVPVVDNWQTFWGDVPISDVQLSLLARHDESIELTNVELQGRGPKVFLGMALGAVGTGLSSVGWVLVGQDQISQGISLPLAFGGVIMGALGVIMMTRYIQEPLEPHLAPTPVHRLTRQQSRMLVARVNRRLYEEICQAAEGSNENLQ